MKLFVTGGSGFVGGAVIGAMRDRHEILAMARSEEAEKVVAALGAEPVRCSLEDVTASHLAGVQVVIHCAGYVHVWGPAETYHRAHVDGTRNILAAAQGAGVSRVVHISTESVLFNGDHLRDMDETWPYPTRSPFPYSTTKAEAERMVLAANSQAMETIVLRPVLIWGPGDRSYLPELTAMAEAGRFAWLDRGRHRVSPTHIENLTHAIGLAIDGGRPGEVYFITDLETPTQLDFAARYAATAGVTLPSRSIPGWLARGLGATAEAAWRVFRPGHEPPLSRFAAAPLSRETTVSCARAARALGYAPVVSIHAGLRHLIGD